ncbi:LysR family transcriptional regulator [Sphingobium nicotianae]|uniref:LysR family transcriptional regulator n=1 Tax=Sphingobium nicotianae TaxID=2782607 RepID=A0A9X1DBW9_9SPHN|nr:LysR family transcriptional regulator [Sphingobium nicotianae]MBT2187088.1 LysR family transcriptional regulator [Sphingobium nicotianae]
MDRITLRQLEALDMIAREGSFRAAARALGVSQVAVSDHIKQLEARLGVSLFDRERGGKGRLSAAGEAALGRARLILADCDALVSNMRDFVAQDTGRPVPKLAAQAAVPLPIPAEHRPVEIAIAPEMPVEPKPAPHAAIPPVPSDQPIMIGTHASILARFQDKLAAFEDAFPNRPVSVDFNCFVADRVALALSTGDISIAYFYALGETRVFPSDYLWSEQWALYVAPSHRLADREFVNREDLLLEGLVSFTAGNRLRPLLEACLAEGGLGKLPFVVESDDYRLLVEQTLEGQGILPLFGAAAARIGGSSGLRRLPYVDPIPAIEVRRVVHPNLAEDDEVQALVATLQ